MPDLIPRGASARPHAVEVRKSVAETWQLYGRYEDRAAAVRALRPLLLHLPAERVRVRPLNPADPDALHCDDRTALLLADARGHVTPWRLAAALGDVKRRGIRHRASHALRRLREADFLQAVPDSPAGAHEITDRGRDLARILERGTMKLKDDPTVKHLPVAMPPETKGPALDKRGSGTPSAPRGAETFPVKSPAPRKGLK